ncbi:hypothetical protein CYMTET_41050 [Cymbomonas tetramitiformis]|uniref:Uncharacterized protein n=1 Tax=Cymbomonas tetramitiformis TaxID=36881 RepID=A0AAE0C6V9_9CHLO|nr:hypothetical protein CYMTET_41050 [Cymbomonas tetramitiformis]
MSVNSHVTPPLGANNRIRLDTIFSRDVGSRYRPTPDSPGVALTAADRTRATAIQNSTWDVDIIKRISRDALGSKDETFRGDESNRNTLWTSIVKSLQRAFEQKDPTNAALFDLADATKEVNAIFNAILFSTLTSLTSPNSPARRWVDASGRASPQDGKRALLEVTKRLIPRVVRPLGHYEELCSIFFNSEKDPDPLIQDFDACLTAIGNGPSGPLDEMMAKKQLLASLDTEFYDKVITPLRLDVELAKVDLEDIYAHVLEIWDANAGRRRHVPLTDKNILYSGQPSDVDVKALIREFQFHIDAANKLLTTLSDEDAHDETTTRWPAPTTGKPTGKPGVHFPPSSWRDRQNRRVDGKFHGRRRDLKHRFAASPLPKDGNWPQGVRRHNGDKKNYGMHSVSFHVLSKAFVPECVRCPPGFWHDSANCPTADIECDKCVVEQADDADGLVSAFQTAFDTEDDTAFARLCAQHDHPLVRQDEEPFTFSEDIDVGLRAQYAGLTPTQPTLLATRVHEARTALRELKQVAGGAESDTQHFPMVHFGSATPSVIGDAVVEHEPEVAIETESDALIYPKQFADGEPPFEQSFMDNVSVKLGFFEPEPQVSLQSFNPLPPYISSTHDSASVADTESDDGDLHDAVPPPAPRVGGVRTPSIGAFLTAAAIPALFLCVSIAMIDTVTATPVLCDVEIAPPSVVYGDCSGYQNGTVGCFTDPDLLDTGPTDFYNIFNLDSDGFGINDLDFQFENCNTYNLCELCSVDHFKGG